MPRQHAARQQVGRAQVDRQRLVEGGGVDLVVGRGPAQAGVGREHVDRPERPLGLVPEPPGRLGIAQVGR